MMDAADDLVSFVQSRRLIGTLDLFPEVFDLALEAIDENAETVDNLEEAVKEQERNADSYSRTMMDVLESLRAIKSTETKAAIMEAIIDIIEDISRAC